MSVGNAWLEVIGAPFRFAVAQDGDTFHVTQEPLAKDVPKDEDWSSTITYVSGNHFLEQTTEGFEKLKCDFAYFAHSGHLNIR